MKSAAQVHYRVSVLEAGRTVARLPRKKNLILDQGLDAVAARTWCENFAVAAAGTGTDPVRRDSGAVTFSRAGNVVTASAGFFVASDVGRLIKWNTGEEARIVTYNSGTEVITADSGTIASDQGTIWYVNRVGLATESKRTNTYGTNGGDNGSTFLTDTWTHKRTFIFSAEVGTVTYREVGWSHTTTPGGNLFGMDLLPGAGVTLVAGQQLKIEVELSVTYAPASSTAWANVIAGWSTPGVHGILASSVSIVDPSGASSITGVATLEPGYTTFPKRVALATNTDAPAPMISGNNVTATGVILGKNLTPAAYTSGSFALTYSATFAVGEANSTAIRSISLGFLESGFERTAYKVLLDAAETKDSDHTLTLTFTLSWGRILTN